MRLSLRLPSFNDNYQRWLDKNLPPSDSIVLARKNIFILPTPSGVLFIIAAVLIFIAAINYTVSLAFGLAFFMVSLIIVAILYGFNNLNQLMVKSLSSPPVFCGEDASFKLLLSRAADRRHEALQLRFTGSTITNVDLVSQDQETVSVFLEAPVRGRFLAPRLRITTYFPLGLCRAWSIVDLKLNCIVYPKPIAHPLSEIHAASAGTGESAGVRGGTEDFYGLREYVKGDPVNQIAWKNVAKGQGMQIKQFVDNQDSKTWLSWDQLSQFSPEERLSRLCFCALKLEKTGSPYGLKLPGQVIAPGTGAEHKNAVLKALALYQ